MGFDWEYLLDAEGEDIAEAYEMSVYEANKYFEDNDKLSKKYFEDNNH